MAMLDHAVDVLDMSDKTITFKYNNKVNMVEGQDVHVMDKEFVNG
jgi:hypothetical protein